MGAFTNSHSDQSVFLSTAATEHLRRQRGAGRPPGGTLSTWRRSGHRAKVPQAGETSEIYWEWPCSFSSNAAPSSNDWESLVTLFADPAKRWGW